MADRGALVDVGELRWTLAPIHPLERTDPLALPTDVLVEYAADLQHDTAALRAALHEAGAQLHDLTRQADRDRLRIHSLVAQLRALHRNPQRKVSV